MATVLTEQPTSESFGDSRLWNGAAPRRLVEKWSAADAARRWNLWQRHLARRKRPRRPPFLAGKRPPVIWCWPAGDERDQMVAFFDSLSAQPDFAFGRGSDGNEPFHALEAVATAYALPDMAAILPANSWWDLIESLHELARDAQASTIDDMADPRQILRHQLLAGELPLTLSYLFPELAPLERLAKPARNVLSTTIVAETDGRGGLHARLLPVFGLLLACWTRSRWLGARLKRGCWSRAAETQYRWLIRRALQLADGRRRFLTSVDPSEADSRDVGDLLAVAIKLAGDTADCGAAAVAVSPSIVPQRVKVSDDDLPKASFHSEWGGLAVLASGWSKSAPRLVVAFADDPPSLELRVGGRQILAGSMTMETTCDGRPVTPVGNWEEVCWQSDEDCDYLELGIDLSDGLALERQILLAKQDAVLYVADIIVAGGRTPHQLQHTLGLPLGQGTTWRLEKETRDGVLAAGKQRIAVLPLALHEWRSDPRGGRLEAADGRLTLTQEATGAALACPLMFDLNSSRSNRERSWRQLTIAESLQVVPRDMAVGFRAQSGRDQWLFYRSLGPAGNRTLIGQNFSGEFVAGRFLATGECDEWIEIEATV